MAGLIKAEDIKAVREAVRLDEIVSEYVTLRGAGVGTLKGLCPFHDEKTPSFTVRPQVGAWHCFGCGEGGDAISFVQQIEHLSFVDAVQWLASRTNITLRFEEGGAGYEPNVRRRLMDANSAAQEFFAAMLLAPGARVGRDFLRAKGFDRVAAELFGVGFAPDGWDYLVKHLRSKGFTQKELVEAGLVSTSKSGDRVYDRFRGRLVWPIRDVTGGTIGFGARKLLDSDQGPKYLNTPETPVYRKSHVLYGLDLAKRQIAKESQVVVVEGYTDVMACHLAGIQTAVATCGTAFGVDHVKLLRRMLMTDDVMTGEVIFTFDGDEAGRKAALKAFDLDEQFLARTSIATGPDGMDPNDIRVHRGDVAVREMFEHKQPLYDFVVRSRLDRWDTSTIEGRAQALRDIAPVLKQIKGEVTRTGYVHQVAGWLGLREQDVRQAMSVSKRPVAFDHQEPEQRSAPQTPTGGAVDDPLVTAERELLKVLVQYPEVMRLPGLAELDASYFYHVPHQTLFELLMTAGLRTGVQAGAGWMASMTAVSSAEQLSAVTWLAMSALPVTAEEDSMARYAQGLMDRLTERRLADRKSELLRQLSQVVEPSSAESVAVQREIVVIDQARQALRNT